MFCVTLLDLLKQDGKTYESDKTHKHSFGAVFPISGIYPPIYAASQMARKIIDDGNHHLFSRNDRPYSQVIPRVFRPSPRLLPFRAGVCHNSTIPRLNITLITRAEDTSFHSLRVLILCQRRKADYLG